MKGTETPRNDGWGLYPSRDISPAASVKALLHGFITDNAGADPVRFRREIVRDVHIALELTDYSGMIIEVICRR